MDADIGGRAAKTVGRRLKQLAAAYQVLCMTHLPQIAGFGDHHYYVEKRESGGRTAAVIEELSQKDRTREIGRMLSGGRLTPEALKQAEQLLSCLRFLISPAVLDDCGRLGFQVVWRARVPEACRACPVCRNSGTHLGLGQSQPIGFVRFQIITILIDGIDLFRLVSVRQRSNLLLNVRIGIRLNIRELLRCAVRAWIARPRCVRDSSVRVDALVYESRR